MLKHTLMKASENHKLQKKRSVGALTDILPGEAELL